MKFTGNDLYDIWRAECIERDCYVTTFPLILRESREAWDALAEKLNGMMTGDWSTCPCNYCEGFRKLMEGDNGHF